MPLDPSIPLAALRSSVPIEGPSDWMKNAYSLANLKQSVQASQLKYQQEQEAAQRKQKAMSIYGQGLNDDETIKALRSAGLADYALDHEKQILERNRIYAQMSEQDRLAHKQQLDQMGGLASELLKTKEGSPERTQAYRGILAAQQQSGANVSQWPEQPPDDATLKAIIAQSMSAKEAADLEDRKQQRLFQEQQANKPSSAGAGFIDVSGHRIQPFFGRNPDTGAWEMRKQDLGEAAEKPPSQTPAPTIRTAKGVMQWNPDTKAYDIKVGDLPPTSTGGSATGTDVKDTADGIIEGRISPNVSQSVSYKDRTAVSAELSRRGYNQTEALRDWQAITRHLATLNGAQQERLRQAVAFADDTIPQLEEAYQRWKKAAGISGIKVFNRAALATSKQFGGEAGSAATQLEALIKDYTAELGTVYKGGNSSTDESLKLAGENLKAEWNEQTFNDALKRIKQSIRIRRNSIATSQPVGVNPNSPYLPPSPKDESKDPLGIR